MWQLMSSIITHLRRLQRLHSAVGVRVFSYTCSNDEYSVKQGESEAGFRAKEAERPQLKLAGMMTSCGALVVLREVGSPYSLAKTPGWQKGSKGPKLHVLAPPSVFPPVSLPRCLWWAAITDTRRPARIFNYGVNNPALMVHGKPPPYRPQLCVILEEVPTCQPHTLLSISELT